MNRWSRIPFARFALTLALLVALVGSAWAHRGPAVEITDEMLAYVAAGGSLDDICSDGTGDPGHATCDACRLVDSISLAGVGTGPVPLVVLARPGVHVPELRQTRAFALDPSRLSRAPPQMV